MGTTLLINPGSSSKKIALFEAGTCRQTWNFEQTGQGHTLCVTQGVKKQSCEDITATEYANALSLVHRDILDAHYVSEISAITAVGVRVVAPASYFTSHRVIDSAYIDKLSELEWLAPHHIPPTMAEITAAQKLFPHARLVGVSDSAFHTTIDPVHTLVGIPRSDAERFDIRSFGYHGISVASVLGHLAVKVGKLPERIIVAHIGSGVSVTAVLQGRSIATSMGYTPASGIVMSSRMSDVPADVLAVLATRKSLSKIQLFEHLYNEGGFKGLAGVKDLRLILDQAEKNDKSAREALTLFALEVKDHIARYAMRLGGVDLIVLTATAAERNPTVRQLLVGELPLLDTYIDEARNETLMNTEGHIHADGSKVQILVLKTDELSEMYRVVQQV